MIAVRAVQSSVALLVVEKYSGGSENYPDCLLDDKNALLADVDDELSRHWIYGVDR